MSEHLQAQRRLLPAGGIQVGSIENGRDTQTFLTHGTLKMVFMGRVPCSIIGMLSALPVHKVRRLRAATFILAFVRSLESTIW